MAALEGAWSGDAEAACVKVCELGPTSELCKGGIERLTGHGSARLADAQAFGFVLRISAAGDPKGSRLSTPVAVSGVAGGPTFSSFALHGRFGGALSTPLLAG